MASLLLLAAGMLVAEGVLAAAVARGLPLAPMLAWHMLILAASGAWLFRSDWRRTRYGVLLWLSTAAFGPLGGAGVLLAIVVEHRRARHATSLDDWHASLFPPSENREDALPWRRIGQRESDKPFDTDVTPFLDILTFGSVPQRQAAVGIMVQQFNPAFAPALRAALRDEHNVVRVQAATAIARLEQQFFERTVELEAAVARAPGDADAVAALAAHFDDQAFTGLLDPTREERCRVKATELYARRIELRPDDLATEFRLARLLLRRGLAADAEPRFRRLVAAAYPATGLWLMECLFVQGRYGPLREAAAADVEALRRMAPDVQATVDLWSGRGVEA